MLEPDANVVRRMGRFRRALPALINKEAGGIGTDPQEQLVYQPADHGRLTGSGLQHLHDILHLPRSIERVRYGFAESEQARGLRSIGAEHFAHHQARAKGRAIDGIDCLDESGPGGFERTDKSTKKVRERRWSGRLAIGKRAEHCHRMRHRKFQGSTAEIQRCGSNLSGICSPCHPQGGGNGLIARAAKRRSACNLRGCSGFDLVIHIGDNLPYTSLIPLRTETH